MAQQLKDAVHIVQHFCIRLTAVEAEKVAVMTTVLWVYLIHTLSAIMGDIIGGVLCAEFLVDEVHAVLNQLSVFCACHNIEYFVG